MPRPARCRTGCKIYMKGKAQGVHPNDSGILAENGLNLQAVFNLADLPPDMLAAIEAVETTDGYRQVLVFGHGGPRMWQALSVSMEPDEEHPVDCFSVDVVARFFTEENPTNRYTFLFPQQSNEIPLQWLGRLAGWHHDSPLRIGVNARWGSWFAYRAVALTNTSFTPTAPLLEASPCTSCMDTPCIVACPVATADGDIKLDACVDERLRVGSPCANTCLARLACPVMAEQRYSQEQIAYHYSHSLETIRNHKRSA